MPEQASLAGVPLTQGLIDTAAPSIANYIAAVSEYVRQSPGLTAETKKRAQVHLSAGLSRALAAELKSRVPAMDPQARETDVAGALRVARADLVETHRLDGLRLAVEIKPVNLAVGRAIWNRFGDIRTFAVNIHLKFPFAVVGGVLTVPTFEWGRRGGEQVEVSTEQLIERAARRLARAGGRRTEGDAPHLLEGVALVAYDPNEQGISPNLPAPGLGLRWDEFVNSLVASYLGRFEGAEEAVAAAESDPVAHE